MDGGGVRLEKFGDSNGRMLEPLSRERGRRPTLSGSAPL